MTEIVKAIENVKSNGQFKYVIFDKGVRILRVVNKNNDRIISIPDHIDNLKVISITEQCFYDCSIVEEIILPDTLEEICAYAFALCKQLKKVNIPQNVCEIGYAAFRDTAILEITIPGSVKVLRKGVFSFCNLQKINLCEGVEKIESHVFYASRIEELSLPDSVKVVEPCAFCTDIGRILVTSKLPMQEIWFRDWPFGEKIVLKNGRNGTIVDTKVLSSSKDIDYECLEITVNSKDRNKTLFYPALYGEYRFVSQESQKSMERSLGFPLTNKDKYNIRQKLDEIYSAWQKGEI